METLAVLVVFAGLAMLVIGFVALCGGRHQGLDLMFWGIAAMIGGVALAGFW